MDERWKALIVILVVVVPVLGSFLWGITDRLLKYREKKLEIDAQRNAEQAARSAAHTERLEQRVRVLERIVTDKGLEVSDEIERLRDAPLN